MNLIYTMLGNLGTGTASCILITLLMIGTESATGSNFSQGREAVLKNCGLISPKPKKSVRVKEKLVREAVSIIQDCPPWTRLKSGDIDEEEMVQKILECLKQLNKFDSGVLRKAIQQHYEESLYKFPEETNAWGRILLINRYIFNVPEQIRYEGILYGGWAGVPLEDGKLNWLWPLSLNEKGNIQITGRYGGYSGPNYYAVLEFDYFACKFGRRKFVQHKN